MKGVALCRLATSITFAGTAELEDDGTVAAEGQGASLVLVALGGLGGRAGLVEEASRPLSPRASSDEEDPEENERGRVLATRAVPSPQGRWTAAATGAVGNASASLASRVEAGGGAVIAAAAMAGAGGNGDCACDFESPRKPHAARRAAGALPGTLDWL